MGYYWLPLEPSNCEFANKFTYLTIIRPEPKKAGKKQSKVESKEYRENFEKHKLTLKKLEGKYFNTYNNPVEMKNIIDSWSSRYFDDFNGSICVFKIKPTSSKKTTEQYSRIEKHMVWEFEVINKITNRNEFIKQIVEDGLLQEFYQNYFLSKCYGNPEYKEELISFVTYIHDNYPDKTIYISDLIRQSQYPYDRAVRDVYDITREHIRYVIEKGFVSIYKDYEDAEDILRILLDMKLFDVALQYVKKVPQDMLHYITDTKLSHYAKLEKVFKNSAVEEDVKEILKYLGIKLSGVALTVTKIEYVEYGRDNEKVVETVNFDDVGQAKSHLIKQYDVPFEEMKKDINNISYRPEEYTEYKFELA